MSRALKIVVCSMLALLMVSAAWAQSDTKKKPAKSGKSSTKKKPANAKPRDEADEADDTSSPRDKGEPKPRLDHAEPTDKRPNDLLDVNADPVLEELANQLDELNDQILQAIADMEKKQSGKSKGKGGASNKEILEVGMIGAKIMRMEKLAARLMNAGEPLGWDIFYRMPPLRARFDAVFGPFRSQDGVIRQIPAIKTALAKETKSKEKVLVQVDKLCGADKWEEADELLAETLLRLDAMGAYFEPAQRPYKDLAGKYTRVHETLLGRVQLSTRENAKQSQQDQWPAFDDLLKQVQEAQAAIRTAGVVQANDGQSLSGPAMIGQLADSWRNLQIAAIRCQGLDWAIGAAKGSAGLDASKLINEQTKFDKDMRAALAGIIAADAERATGSEAERLYVEYLQSIASVCALSGSDRTLFDAAETALAQLAAKSTALNSDVASYRAATSDLLRWRSRTAQAYVRKHKSAYPLVEEAIWGAAGPNGANLGLGQRTGGEYKQGNSLAKASNQVLEMAGPPLLKAKVTAGDTLGTRNEAPWSLSSCNGISFTRLPSRLDVNGAITQLEADLLAGASLPPLSLEATLAIASARLGDFQAAGGEVTEIGLHAVVPRLTKLTDNAWGLIRLAPLWPIQPSTSMEKMCYLRCDLQPDWVQHRYFYLELFPETRLSAAP
ncbi:MAG: hypothetical protein AB7O62_01615 [Pirellulales bacterium]